MRRILYRQADFHESYARYIPLVEKFIGESLDVRGRVFATIRSDFYLIGAIKMVLGESLLYCKILFEKTGKVVFVREFSSLVVLLFCCGLWFKRRNIIFNINHNLNNRVERMVIRNFLSKVFRVGFICPTSEIRKEFPNIEALWMSYSGVVSKKPCRQAMFLVGVREEQWAARVEEVVSKLRSELSASGLNVFVLGRHPRIDFCEQRSGLEESELIEQLGISIAFFLYSTKCYAMRHSGLLWDALIYSHFVFFPKNNMFLSQASAFANWEALDVDAPEKLMLGQIRKAIQGVELAR